MTRVAVTGGSGFIAGWCIAQLLDEGHEVVTTIRSPQREAGVRAAAAVASTERLSFRVADLSGDDGWDDALAGCEVVLHVASPMSAGRAGTMITEAVEGTLRVLAAADRAGARAHLLAMTSPEAEHQRFIVSGELLWYADIAEILRTHLGDEAGSVPSAALTDEEFRSLAQMSPVIAGLLPLLGRDLLHSSANARSLLGWRSRPAVDTIVDSARCLLGSTGEGRSG